MGLVHPRADRQAAFLHGFQNKWFAFIGLLKEYFKGHKTVCSLNVALCSLEVRQHASEARCRSSHWSLLTLLLSTVTPHLF